MTQMEPGRDSARPRTCPRHFKVAADKLVLKRRACLPYSPIVSDGLVTITSIVPVVSEDGCLGLDKPRRVDQCQIWLGSMQVHKTSYSSLPNFRVCRQSCMYCHTYVAQLLARCCQIWSQLHTRTPPARSYGRMHVYACMHVFLNNSGLRLVDIWASLHGTEPLHMSQLQSYSL